MKSKYLFLRCDCSSHALQLEYDSEDKYLYASIWERGLSNPTLSWKERIRWAWQLLIKGNPWGDSVCLKKEEIKKLQHFINKTLNESNN